MPCYHPLTLFSPDKAKLVVRCGQCVGCRLDHSRSWAVRCMHEASLYENNCSVTLTIDDDHLKSLSLDHSVFQKFMKRARKRLPGLRFFMCGEYGEKFSRPHFHACFFNCDFPDKVFVEKSPAGFPLYSSKLLDSLWQLGRARIGDLTFESAAYVARYVMKKVGSDGELREIYDPSTGEIFSRKHEYCQMSRRPGIGADWLRLYHPEVLVKGKVVMNGKELTAPRFYRRRLRDHKDYEEIRDQEFLDGLSRLSEQTPERLAASERVVMARICRLKRSI